MEKVLRIIFIVVAVFVLVGALFLGGAFVGSQFFGHASTAGVGSFPGMMSGNAQQQAGPGFAPGAPAGGPGTANGGPGGRMVRGFGGNNNAPANLTPVTSDEARTAAQAFVTTLKIDGLQVGAITVIGDSAYVTVTETATGNGAFELLVGPVSKKAQPQMGASTLWNLKYGGVLQAAMPYGRGPMMGAGGRALATATPSSGAAAPAATPADVSADMPVSADQAVKDAQAYLDQAVPGATAAASPLKFYGYYSLSFSQNGTVAGILSVNGFNGEVLPAMRGGMMFQRPN